MYFKLAMNFIAQKSSRTVLSVIMCALSVIIIVFTVVISSGLDHAYKRLDSLLTNGAENIAELSIEENDLEFAKELAAAPEINAVGDIQTYGFLTPSELIPSLNKSLPENFKGELEITYMSVGLTDLYEISLQSGEMVKEITDLRKNYLYLGAGYKEVINEFPIGTTFSTETSDYIVAGIMSDGQRLLKDTVIDSINHNQADYTFDGTYSILGIHGGLSTSALLISAADGYTLNDAVDKALALAKEHDVDLKYETLQRAFDYANSYAAVVKSIFSRLMPIMCISCVIMIIIMQLSDIYDSLHGYGILCSVGFEQSDIEKIMMAKNIITFIIALIISLPLTYFLIYFWNSVGETESAVIFQLLLSEALPTAILIVLCTIALSTIISITLIRRYTPIKMIGGYND